MKDIDLNKKRNEQNRQTIKVIKLYVIPIFAVTFFIGLLIFLTIPKISEIFSSLDVISENNNKILENNNKIENLNGLSGQYNTIVQDLSIIDGIAPLGNTEVVKFRDRISQLITSNNLTIISQRLSEANSESDNQSDQASPLILQEVPFIFTVDGTYDNIIKFIQSLNTVEDFIVVKEMQLNVNSDSSELKINIVKYQFNTPTTTNLKALYANVPVDAQLNDLLKKYIQARLSTIP